MNFGSMNLGILRNGGIMGTPPEPKFGETVEDIETLEAQILSSPESYPDGEPVYVEDLDGGGTAGWVVVYEGVPVPVTMADKPTVQQWIDDYGVPDGVSIHVDDDGTGEPGVVIVTGGGPVPAGTIGRTGACLPSYNLNGGDPKRPAPREEGDSFGPILDQTIFPNAASTGDPP